MPNFSPENKYVSEANQKYVQFCLGTKVPARILLATLDKYLHLETTCVILVPKSIEYAPFAMSETVAEKNLPKAMKLLEEFSRTKNTGYSIVPMLTKRIRLLLQIKILIEKGTIPLDIVKRGYYDQKTYGSASKKLSGQHPYLIFKIAQQSLKFQKEELMTDIKKLFETEVSIKTGKVPQKLALELLIAKIC